jgi:hypothetical protein
MREEDDDDGGHLGVGVWGCAGYLRDRAHPRPGKIFPQLLVSSKEFTFTPPIPERSCQTQLGFVR